MKRFDVKQKKLVLEQFRHSGVRLDDAVIINVLYLLQELQATLTFAILDPLFVLSISKQERTCDSIRKTLHNTPELEIVLMPLVLNLHWSLLVFIPSLNGYLHFDSIEGLHRTYVRRLLLLLDEGKRYNELPIHHHGCSQQASDWECGFFLLMNAFLFIHMKSDALQTEETLRHYLYRRIPSVSQKNLRLFARKIYDIVKEL